MKCIDCRWAKGKHDLHCHFNPPVVMFYQVTGPLESGSLHGSMTFSTASERPWVGRTAEHHMGSTSDEACSRFKPKPEGGNWLYVRRLDDARSLAQAMGTDASMSPDLLAKQFGDDAMMVLNLGRAFPGKFEAAKDKGEVMGDLFMLVHAVLRFAQHKEAKERGGSIVLPALEAFALVSPLRLPGRYAT